MAEGVIIAAPSSGSGKTVVTLALLRALVEAGNAVASAKVGPDYIDPRFHAAATGRPCFNLDQWAMRPGTLARQLARLSQTADLIVIEGVMGLFDGPETGKGSTADLADELNLPVVLVVDCSHQAQSIAALVAGFAHFRPSLNLAGVILNRVSSPRHTQLLTQALKAISIPVIGAIPRVDHLALPSRHLGLVQASEHPELDTFLGAAAALVSSAVDLTRLRNLAKAVRPASEPASPLPPLAQRIAVADDQAFGFAYPHLLAGWREQGAEILTFSPLADQAPDDNADAIFLPGGYPELHGPTLSGATGFLSGLNNAARRGTLVYGECGGFMVLGEAILDKSGCRHAMAGLLPLVTSFQERKLQLGYRRFTHESPMPWPQSLCGHEFHFSTIATAGTAPALFHAEDTVGRHLGPTGMQLDNVMGSYAHVIDQATLS